MSTDHSPTLRALIRKDTHPDPAYPWYYTVEHDPPREDALDYGSVESFARALECVGGVLEAERQAWNVAHHEPTD